MPAERTETKGVSRRRFLRAGAFALPTLGWGEVLASGAIGQMTEVRGSVSAQGISGNRLLDRLSQVFIQDLVQTSTGARATLQMGTRTTVRLGENVRFRIDQYTIDRGGTLDLGTGAAFIETRGKQPGGLVVRSPSALVAVRGTSFFVGTERDGVFSVFVRDGSVEVAAAFQVVQLNRGQGTSITGPGLSPEPVRTWGAERINRAMDLVR